MVLSTSKQCKDTAIRRYEKKKVTKDIYKSSNDTVTQQDRKSSINGVLDDNQKSSSDAR